MNNLIYILDACSVLAYLLDEEGAGVVEDFLTEAQENKCKIIMHKINILEIYYGILREDGQQKADLMLETLNNLPISIIDKITDEIFIEAGRLKANYRISLADSIFLSTAKLNKAKPVTADHHEFDIIEKNKELEIVWIR